MSSIATTVTDAARSFGGQLLQPADAGYEDARKVHNGLVDKRPAVVARCRGTADVVDALALARTLGLEVSVRGGGHNVAGRATVDGGVMIDLSGMKGIHVDPVRRTVRAQGGVLWRELNRETQLHGLAVTGGLIGSTGVSGLTLGGGWGWLMPKYGLALDNLIAAEIVLADGRVVEASAGQHPDLFWGIRGGGGNFGVATSLEYALHPVGPVITGGPVVHPFSKAAELLPFFRDTCARVPDEMMVVAGLQTAPDGAKVAAIVAAHCGTPAQAQASVAPIKAFGSPVVDALGPIPYTALNSMLDDAFPKGTLNYWKAQFLTDLSDDAMATIIDAFARCPSPMSHLLLEYFHGAASRIPVDATACTLRVTGYNVVIISQWTDPRDTEVNVAWARDTFKALRPYLGTMRYVNYMEREDDQAAASVYGSNLKRLRELKTKYDPLNVFRHNVNIQPL